MKPNNTGNNYFKNSLIVATDKLLKKTRASFKISITSSCDWLKQNSLYQPIKSKLPNTQFSALVDIVLSESLLLNEGASGKF